MMPERALSIGYGTSTSSPSVWFTGGVLMLAAPANCQAPLRLCQSGRVNWGRGYSGSGLVVETWLVQGVASGGVFGTTAAAGAAVAIRAPVEAVRTAAVQAMRRRQVRERGRVMSTPGGRG